METTRSARSDATLASEPVSGPAPGRDLLLERSDGSTLTLRELEGRPVIVHLWATWCEPCRNELPALLELADDVDDAEFVLASVDEGWAPVRAFFDGTGPSTVVLDRKGALRDAFGLETLPETWVIDDSGELRARIRGSRDWRASGIRRSLSALVESRDRDASGSR